MLPGGIDLKLRTTTVLSPLPKPWPMRVLVALALAVAMLAGCTGAPKSPASPEQQGGVEEPMDEGLPPEEGQEIPEEPSGSSSSSPSSRPKPSGSSSKGPDPPPPPPPEPAPASPPRDWASPETATVRPGASLDNGSCTANFIFTSLDNATVYIGTAAHCFTTSGPTDTDGCQAGSRPLGETMKVAGASVPAVLVYSSWLTMQALDEADGDTCRFNDFALLKLASGDYGKVSPALKHFGGPIGLAEGPSISTLDKVLTYGNSGTRPQDSPLSPKEGYVVFGPGSGWTMSIYTVSPGIPGDSGSAVITADGKAIGDMVTLQGFPPAGNGVSMLSKELEYARLKGGFDVRLATWDLINPGLLPPL